MEELMLEKKPTETEEITETKEKQEAEIEKFLDDFELTPPDKKVLRKYIKELDNLETSTMSVLNEELAKHKEYKEIIQSDFVKELAKRKFTYAVLEAGHSYTGSWVKYLDYFDLDDSFIKDKKFDGVRQKRWLEHIAHGWEFDFKNGVTQTASDSWGNKSTEEEKKENELKEGPWAKVGLSIDSPEVKKVVLEGIRARLFGGVVFGEKVEDTVAEYKEFFKISEAEFEQAVLDEFRRGNIDDFDKNTRLRAEYPFVDKFLNSAEAKKNAKERAFHEFVTGNTSTGEDILKYFEIPKKEIDQKEVEASARQFHVDRLNESVMQNNLNFYFLESASQHLTKEDWQKFFEKNKDSEIIVNALVKGFKSFFGLEKNKELIEKIGVPEETLRQVGIKTIYFYAQNRESYKTLKNLIEIAEAAKLSAYDFDEAFSLALLEQLHFRVDKNGIEKFKEVYEFEKSQIVDTPEVKKKTKEVALEAVARGDLTELNLIEENFDIDWGPEDAQAKRAAVKNALMSEFIVVNQFRSFDEIREFINRFYPKMEKINLIGDPELKEHMEEMISDLAVQSRGQSSNLGYLTKDLIRYFNLSRERIIAKLKNKIEDGSFVRSATAFDAVKVVKNLFPEIDIREETEKSVEKNGEQFVKEALENENWAALERLQNVPKSALLIENFLEEQRKLIFDISKPRSVRIYAMTASSYLSNDFFNSAYLVMININEKVLDEVAGRPELLRKLEEIGEHIPESFWENSSDWSYLFERFKDMPLEDLIKEGKLLKRILDYKNRLHAGPKLLNVFIRVVDEEVSEQEEFFKILGMRDDVPNWNLGEQNWAEGLVMYMNATENDQTLSDLNTEQKAKIINLFSGEYKDVCLNGLRHEWIEFLESDKKMISPKLLLVVGFVDHVGGAGNLKHIESLSDFIYQLNKVSINPKTVDRTKEEIKDLVANQEKRFDKEKWSGDDRSEFYNLSRDVMTAAPSLYSAFGPIFESLSPKELKSFMKEVMPLYQAELIIKQKNTDSDGEFVYDARELVGVRKSLQEFSKNLQNTEANKTKIFENEKTRLTNLIQANFKERFGVHKVPVEFTKEHIRSIQNSVRYIGNVSGRNEKKEALIAFFLGLELNGKWGEFRQGAPLDPAEYLSGKQLEIIAPILEKKKEMANLLLESGGLTEEDLPRFQEILQEDVLSNMIGNVQTIDVRLGNVSRNISELADPDIYPDKSEKEMLSLLIAEGKKVGATLSKTFAESTGKKIQLSPEERELQSKVAKIFNISKWSGEQVKTVQDLVQPLGLIVNMINRLEEEKVNENIEELQKRLVPPEKVIEVFNRLGESFKQESGAMALSKDITYLESLVVKDSQKIAPEERLIVTEYLDSIKDKMKDLERVLDRVKEYFDKIKKSLHVASRPILNERLTAIEKIIYATDESGIITSRMTKDLNLIIENMRQCLGCLRKEANNDTNLAFGDYNKFFLINQAGKEEGSVSDEILFFVPVRRPDGHQEMSFVLDNVYGSKGPDVLIGNALAVFKKYNALKKEFPQARLSISVSQAALSSVGLNAELFEKRLKQELKEKFETDFVEGLVAAIPKSAFSDNYIEFGSGATGGARTAGEKEFSGLVIK